MREHNIVYGAKAGVCVIKPCSSRKMFRNRFYYIMVRFILCVNLFKCSEDPRGRTGFVINFSAL